MRSLRAARTRRTGKATSPNVSCPFQTVLATCLGPLLVAPVALTFRCDGLRVMPPVRAQRSADIVLRIREVAFRIASDVPLITLVWLDQLTFARHLITSLELEQLSFHSRVALQRRNSGCNSRQGRQFRTDAFSNPARR